MPSITYRRLSENEVARIREIDRTERVRIGYRVEGDHVTRMDVIWDSSPWREEGEEHSFPHMIHLLEGILASEGSCWGRSMATSWLDWRHFGRISQRRWPSLRFCT